MNLFKDKINFVAFVCIFLLSVNLDAGPVMIISILCSFGNSINGVLSSGMD